MSPQPATSQQQPLSLASQYHNAKSERKCLTSSFKVKTNFSKDGAEDKVATRPKTALVVLDFNEKPTTRKAVPSKPKLTLAKEYHATRRSFTASRAVHGKENIRQEKPVTARSKIAGEESVRSKAATAKSKPSLTKELRATQQSQKVSPESPPATKFIEYQQFRPMPNESTQLRHTAMTGYELLGISRLDDKRHEFGLSDGIKLHLIESIKLCGFRKAREKSLADMITTLCSHLSDREGEIDQWMDFADNIAIAGAEKLSQSIMDFEAALSCIEHNRQVAKSTAARLACVHEETMSLKAELSCIKGEVKQTMEEFKSSLDESWIALKQERSNQFASVQSECKSELHDAIDNLSAKHNNETKCLESQICSLRHSIKLEREKLAKVNTQLNDASIAISQERHKQTVLQNEFEIERQELNSKQIKSDEEIIRLNSVLEDEKASKRAELAAMQERMNNEFDMIELKVKRSMKLLIDSKNKEIEEALTRAKDAEQILSELKTSVTPIIFTAESSSEK